MSSERERKREREKIVSCTYTNCQGPTAIYIYIYMFTTVIMASTLRDCSRGIVKYSRINRAPVLREVCHAFAIQNRVFPIFQPAYRYEDYASSAICNTHPIDPVDQTIHHVSPYIFAPVAFGGTPCR